MVLSFDLFHRFCDEEHLTLLQGVVHNINRVDYEVQSFVLVVGGSLILAKLGLFLVIFQKLKCFISYFASQRLDTWCRIIKGRFNKMVKIVLVLVNHLFVL